MDHSHKGHGDMDMGDDQCSMNMLFTWSAKNLCIIFPQWHVRGTLSLVLSLVAIVVLTAGYEYVRDVSRRYEQQHNSYMDAFGASSTSANESSSLLSPGKDAKSAAQRKGMLVKGLLYAVQVFYSFFIMLLFMTYNGWVMLAVAVGAFLGYIIFGQNLSSAKTVACH